MPTENQTETMLYDLDDRMIECPECRKTVTEEDYEWADRCMECDTLLRITLVPSRLDRSDLVEVIRGPFEGKTGAVRGLTTPSKVELRILSWDVKRPVEVRVADVTKTGEVVDPETMAVERPREIPEATYFYPEYDPNG